MEGAGVEGVLPVGAEGGGSPRRAEGGVQLKARPLQPGGVAGTKRGGGGWEADEGVNGRQGAGREECVERGLTNANADERHHRNDQSGRPNGCCQNNPEFCPDRNRSAPCPRQGDGQGVN